MTWLDATVSHWALREASRVPQVTQAAGCMLRDWLWQGYGGRVHGDSWKLSFLGGEARPSALPLGPGGPWAAADPERGSRPDSASARPLEGLWAPWQGGGQAGGAVGLSVRPKGPLPRGKMQFREPQQLRQGHRSW